MTDISVVSTKFVESNTLGTYPTFAAGDFALIFGINEGSATAVTCPASSGISNFRSGGGRWSFIGGRQLVTGSETPEIWTNATKLGCVIFRSSYYLGIGDSSNTNGTGVSIPYAGSGMNFSSGLYTGWLCGFGFGVDTAQTGAPSGMTNRGGLSGASSGHIVYHDTNGDFLNVWTSQSVTPVTSQAYHAWVFRVRSTGILIPSGGGAVRRRAFAGGYDRRFAA